VIACGADRLLTSGGEANATHGIERIARLRKAAGNRIRIMAGAGIRQANVRNFVRQTGVREIHTSLRARNGSAVNSSAERHGGLHVKIGSHEDEFSRFLVVEKDVRRFKSTLQEIRAEADLK
jgi:copper homeostasis protein CutC